METRYLNQAIKEKLLKTTSLSPFKLNIDWPSIKQLGIIEKEAKEFIIR